MTQYSSSIKLSDSISGKTKLVPLIKNSVCIYVCGITPYDFSHVGHGRVYVTFDVLFRLFKFLEHHVSYCRNFTDIDDKLIKKAQEQLHDATRYHEIADIFIKAFQEDMHKLNCLAPSCEPRVTQNIPIIITFIQDLIKKNVAYEVDGDVYFHVPAFKDYGKLSKHDIKNLQAGTRIEISEKKKNSLDFALWKHEPNITYWQSPWGNGRPGWHIECSAIALKFLGEHINIHGGGMDLLFPHHENEIAQTESLTSKPFADIWMHVSLVRINKEKMSKSLNNFFTLRDVFKEFDPMVVRYYYLAHHYRSPLDFSFNDLQAAQKAYHKLSIAFDKVSCITQTKESIMKIPIIQTFIEDLCNDLNTPSLFGHLFAQLHEIQNNEKIACAVKYFLQDVIGLTLAPLTEKKIAITSEIQQLIDEREKARAEKNWKKSDALRDKLRILGYEVNDKKS